MYVLIVLKKMAKHWSFRKKLVMKRIRRYNLRFDKSYNFMKIYINISLIYRKLYFCLGK